MECKSIIGTKFLNRNNGISLFYIKEFHYFNTIKFYYTNRILLTNGNEWKSITVMLTDIYMYVYM